MIITCKINIYSTHVLRVSMQKPRDILGPHPAKSDDDFAIFTLVCVWRFTKPQEFVICFQSPRDSYAPLNMALSHV